ncbi:MAG: AgmX/PglI C-terminal domain-containing protein [Myxococcales bacterium]|nr:AgmX/PglI C-terminal domain-containing protein [Myxococcales bacterium]
MNRNIVMVGAGIVAVGAFLAVWLLGGEAEMAEGSTPRTIQGTEGEAAPPAPLPALGSSGRPDDPEPAPAEGPRPKGAAELAQALVAKHNRPDGSLPMDPVGGDAGVPEGWAEGDALPPIPMIRFVADREGIQAAVQERKRQIQECYDGWAKSPDAPEGKIVARFTIAPGGPGMPAQIKDAGLTASGLNHLAMEGCVLNALEGLGFESPEGEVTVNYPFILRPTPEE